MYVSIFELLAMAMVPVARGGRARRFALCPRAALSRARALRCRAPARCCYTGLKLAAGGRQRP